MNNSTIIIGIDPGTRVTGYGIIALTNQGIQAIDYGCIRPPPDELLSTRYLIIFDSIQMLLAQHCPPEQSEMAIETQFVQKNAQVTIKLGMARAAAVIAGKKQNLKIFGYAPREVKCFISGTGNASKAQLQQVVGRFLNLKQPPEPYDAADALSIAICHAHRRQNQFFDKVKEL